MAEIMLRFFVCAIILHFSYGKNHIANDRYLTDYQNRTMILPVDCTNGIRAGSIYLSPDEFSYPKNGFYVNVTLPSTCAAYKYNLYFNIKGLNLNDDDTIFIYKRSFGLQKTLDGGRHWPFYNPTSVGQYYAETNYFDIVFKKGSFNYQQYSTPLSLDYAVMNTLSSDSETYCSALYSYQLQRLMCMSDDRVVCPTTYTRDPRVTNPVISKDDYSCSQTGLSPATVILLGSVGALLLFGLPVAACLIHRRRRFRYVTYQSLIQPACEDDHVHSQTVVNSYGAVYPNTTGVFAGPPPSYADVSVPGGNQSVNNVAKP